MASHDDHDDDMNMDMHCEDGVCYIKPRGHQGQEGKEEEEAMESIVTEGAQAVRDDDEDDEEHRDDGMDQDNEDNQQNNNAEGGLGVGSQLPEFGGLKYIKGKPVDNIGKPGQGRVLVVEFWASWCPPCERTVPHLGKLQRKLRRRGVVILGISSEDESDVKAFVKRMGKKMDYVVALDAQSEARAKVMKPLRVEGIPHAVVVNNDNKIVFSGHPMDPQFEDALTKAYEELNVTLPEEEQEEDESAKEKVQINPDHKGIACYLCHKPIVGVRFKCAECEDLNLCQECETSGQHDPTHARMVISHHDPSRSHGGMAWQLAQLFALLRSANFTSDNLQRRDDEGKVIHGQVGCDVCRKRPVVGIRYKCLVCDNCDLCEACETKGEHEKDHPLLKMPLYTPKLPSSFESMWDSFESGSMADSVEKVLEDLEIEYDSMPEGDRTKFRFVVPQKDKEEDKEEDKEHKIVFIVVADEKRSLLMLLGFSDFKIPADKLAVASEVIARINMRLNAGSLDIDHEDGELRFRLSAPLDMDAPKSAEKVIRTVINTGQSTPGRLFDAIRQSIERNLSAEETLDLLDGGASRRMPQMDERMMRLLMAMLGGGMMPGMGGGHGHSHGDGGECDHDHDHDHDDDDDDGEGAGGAVIEEITD